ncbi:MAG TPA: lipid-binding SYLF domain-containing protein [Myxococcota bacterium]|nr:lipid-binding SYLF domain-containing protein [Myxococcota bacterium]
MAKLALKRFLAVAVLVAVAGQAVADDNAKLDKSSAAALKKLVAKTPAAKALSKKAYAVLVFPSILKAGFMVGGQVGSGTLFDSNGKVLGHYRSYAASYGWQAGAQKFGYSLFFMNKGALDYLNTSGGWDVGVGPSIVVVDEGMGKSSTASTMTQDIYAFIFSQSGLMAGAGLQGSKITKTD